MLDGPCLMTTVVVPQPPPDFPINPGHLSNYSDRKSTLSGTDCLANVLALSRARPEDAAAWDEFVDRHPEGRFSHLWGYRQVLEQAYGYRCVYLDILADGERVGIFPSIVVRRGRGRLVSQPFNEYGGPLTQGLSADQQESLARLLMNAAREAGCAGIEIRGGLGWEGMAQSAFCAKHRLHSYAVLRLSEEQRLWRDSLTYEARKSVNRARKAGLTVEVRRGRVAIDEPFYELYLASMKRLGVPPHSRQFFVKLAQSLGERLVCAWVTDKWRAVAMLLGALTGERVHVFITASDGQAWSMRPNDLAHWELMRWAVENGFHLFDFGSARYSGQLQFKKKWGVTLYEYGYYCVGSSDTRPSSQLVETSSRSMTALSSCWKWIVPNRWTPLLGPPIRRYLTK
jgi:CelD/BcsL family acetyltransferase involved in cellulose biosynthesis